MRRPTLLFALAIACAACSHREPQHAIRNVILISCDTLRADALASFDGAARKAERGSLAATAKTPTLDRLAREGIVFESTSSVAPSTLASHTSLFTGLAPHSHGVARNGFVLSPQCPTLATILKSAGFRTAGFAGSFALDRRFGIAQGFDVWNQDFDLLVDGNTHEQNERRAEKVTDAVLAYVDAAAKSADPAFLFVHYFDVHAPYDPPNCEVRAVDGIPVTGSIDDLRRAVLMHQAGLEKPPRGLDRAIVQGLDPRWPTSGFAELPIDRELTRRYLAEVEYVDAQIGRLLDGLEKRGVLRDSLVVFVADHGESFFEHDDFYNHGLAVYDTTVHVPWILRLPDGAFAGRRVAAPVSNIDVAPTILELVGIARPERCDGVGRAAAIDGRAPELAPIFGGATQPRAAEHPRDRWVNDSMAQYVRLGDLKLIETPYLRREELYDLAKDPYERVDLLATGDAATRKLRDELHARLENWRASAAPLPSQFDRGQVEEVERRLKQLGYTGDSNK